MKRMISAVTLLGLVGCSGSIIVHENAETACVDGRCEGVKFYQLVPTTEHYYLDRITGKDGALTHWAGGPDDKRCMPVLMTETKLLPSSKASVITYDAQPFETSKFSVELAANGTLAKAGGESTPGAKMAADTLSTIATSAKTLRDSNVLGAEPKSMSWVDPLEAMASGEVLCSGGRVPVTAPLGPRTEHRPASKCGGTGQPRCLQ